MSNIRDLQQLILQYESLRTRMRKRIEELAKSYEHAQPMKHYFALLKNDKELEVLDAELCELEGLLPDSYQNEPLFLDP